MAERFTSDLAFIILVLLVAALLGFLIGYYVRKSMKCKKCTELEENNASLNLKLKTIGEENGSMKGRIERLDAEISALKIKAEKLEAEARNAAKVKTVKGVRIPASGKIVQDDLKIVLGIGPKISKLLINRGISTWKALSEMSPAVITEYLLKDGGDRYRIHKTDSWPHQALLANEGRWDELRELQGKMVV